MAANPTSLVIVIEAASFLQPFREKHLLRPGVTMPPHITVWSPFLPGATVDEQVRRQLQEVCASFAPFTFTLDRIGRFQEPGILYLVPEPSAIFHDLSKMLRRTFLRETADKPVFHLTLAGHHPGELDKIEGAFYLRHADQLPIAAEATDISLFERVEKTWVKRFDCPLSMA